MLPEFRDNREAISSLDHHDYVRLLSTSIVFQDLHDTSAKNAVVACIARATRQLANGIASVEEYEGANYPICFETLEETAVKVQDVSLIWETHAYTLQS